MISAIILFFNSILVPLVLIGQNTGENWKKDVKMYIGFSPGLFLSKFIPGYDGSHSGGIDVTYEDKFIPRLQVGCSI
jgi:hypothetical protein